MLHHLDDRQSLAATPLGVSRREPVEAKVGIVGPLLFGKEESKAMLIRGARPIGTSVVAAGSLSAAMKNDNQGSATPKVRRNIASGKQVARVRSKAVEFR
jgi:hypothetical protein